MTIPKSKKSEETKENIMRSAHQLFHQKGFEATSVREIVEAAGYAKGTFYLYYETKMDLLKEMVNDLLSLFKLLIHQCFNRCSEEPFDQINRFLDQLVIRFREQECCMRLFHSHEMMELIFSEKTYRDLVEDSILPVKIFIEQGIERGYFRSLDATLYAKMYFEMIHSITETSMLYDYPDTIEKVMDESKIFIRKTLEK